MFLRYRLMAGPAPAIHWGEAACDCLAPRDRPGGDGGRKCRVMIQSIPIPIPIPIPLLDLAALGVPGWLVTAILFCREFHSKSMKALASIRDGGGLR
jgi:hypothetical protein